MKTDRLVNITFFEDGEPKVERAYVEYIGHHYEYVAHKKYIGTGSGYIDVTENVPMQVIVFVCRIISSGKIVLIKPEGVRYDSASLIKG